MVASLRVAVEEAPMVALEVSLMTPIEVGLVVSIELAQPLSIEIVVDLLPAVFQQQWLGDSLALSNLL